LKVVLPWVVPLLVHAVFAAMDVTGAPLQSELV
jgi:hypothetical protein